MEGFNCKSRWDNVRLPETFESFRTWAHFMQRRMRILNFNNITCAISRWRMYVVNFGPNREPNVYQNSLLDTARSRKLYESRDYGMFLGFRWILRWHKKFPALCCYRVFFFFFARLSSHLDYLSRCIFMNFANKLKKENLALIKRA